MRKEERIRIVLEKIDEMFPDAQCELNYENPLQLLIAVCLSAQTTDKSVNQVTPALFEKYPDVNSLCEADQKDIEQLIKRIGLYRNKASNIKKLAYSLRDNFNGVVPSSMEELTSLPGVGRKTANVVRSVAFDIPALAVDTHVERVSKRLKLAKQEDSVLDVERKLCKLIKKERWSKTHHQLIFFGRYFCKAIRPSCLNCPLVDICDYKQRINKLLTN